MNLPEDKIELMAQNLKKCSKQTIKDVLNYLDDEERQKLIKELKKVLDFDPEVL